MVAVEGLRYEDAAAVLDLPVGTVRSRLFRARTMLRELLDSKASPVRPYREYAPALRTGT
jgi:RNA polymerase sigma-70 factor (ECF subfamily)